jgi:oligopeptide transport system substrate-binding protein
MRPVMLIVLLLSVAVSCTKQKNDSLKELNLISVSKIAGYDPIQASDYYQTQEIGKVYEGLYEYHPTKRPYELVAALAESMPEVSQDQLTYTFKIRKGVYFHDDKCFPSAKGRELKAQDFEYSFKRLADPKLVSKGWWLFEGKLAGVEAWRQKFSKADKTDYAQVVEGIRSLDDNTFQLKLVKPFPQLMYGLAMPFTVAVPKEAVEHYGPEFLNHPVGTGPFILPNFDQSNLITYLKNPNYREKYYPSDDPQFSGRKVPFLDRINVHILVESQPRWLNFTKAKMDVIELPKDNYEQALTKERGLNDELKAKGIFHSSNPLLDVTFYAFNHEDPLFKNNVKLRQAMSLAFDRKRMNDLFYVGTGMLANGVIPPGLAGFDPNFKNPFIEFDLVKAKQLLKDAGYPEGKGLPEIVVETVSSTQERQMMELFTKNMKDIGINVRPNFNTWPELVNKMNKKQFMIYTMAWHADYPDAENYLGLLYCPNKTPGSNGSNYCNSKYDEMFRKVAVMPDSPERTKLYAQMNKMIALEVPWMLGLHRTKEYLSQGWVKNFVYSEYFNHLYQYLDVDMEKKKELSKKF